MWTFRAPRVALAALVGAGLAVAGAVLQILASNPLADPIVLGVSLGAVLVIPRRCRARRVGRSGRVGCGVRRRPRGRGPGLRRRVWYRTGPPRPCSASAPVECSARASARATPNPSGSPDAATSSSPPSARNSA
ncbi:iron chelate uptake ABC transporter family permease subunit [Streptomyces mirabilis]